MLSTGGRVISVLVLMSARASLRAKTTLESHLDCQRSRPELAHQLQEKADLAVRQFSGQR
jgi:hypothetical protein